MKQKQRKNPRQIVYNYHRLDSILSTVFIAAISLLGIWLFLYQLSEIAK